MRSITEVNSCITLKQHLTEVTNVSQTTNRWFREVLATAEAWLQYFIALCQRRTHLFQIGRGKPP